MFHLPADLVFCDRLLEVHGPRIERQPDSPAGNYPDWPEVPSSTQGPDEHEHGVHDQVRSNVVPEVSLGLDPLESSFTLVITVVHADAPPQASTRSFQRTRCALWSNPHKPPIFHGTFLLIGTQTSVLGDGYGECHVRPTLVHGLSSWLGPPAGREPRGQH